METPVFEIEPPYDIEDSILVANEGQADHSETIDESQQKLRYPEYCGKVVRLGIDIQTLEYFASKKIMMTNSDDNNNGAYEDFSSAKHEGKSRGRISKAFRSKEATAR